MKLRSRLPVILLIVSLAAMAGAGVGLFRWLDRASTIEGRQLYSTLANGAGRIQSEIALEFAVIGGLLSYPAEKEENWLRSADTSRWIADLYWKWHEGTRFPDLIQSIYVVVDGIPGRISLRYSGLKGAASEDTTVAPDAVADIFAELASAGEESGLYRIASFPDGLALMISIMGWDVQEEIDRKKEKRGVVDGYLVVLLDRKYFADEVVARLFEAYFGSTERRFSFALIGEDRGELLTISEDLQSIDSVGVNPRAADIIVPLTAWISTEGSLLTDVLSAADEGSIALSGEGLNASFRDLIIRQWYGFLQQETDEPDREPMPGRRQGVNLYIRHTAGSIEKAVRVSRNRRLAIGNTVVVSFALVAIIFYILFRRARELRDREHEFVATVTHELRTPISGVSAAADNLAEGIVKDPDQIKEYGKAILNHGRRLKDLIDKVLLYAGLTEQSSIPGGSTFAVADVVKLAVASLPELPKARLIMRLQPDLPLFLGDSDAVEMIVSNLLINAFKHNDENVTVTLHLYRNKGSKRSWLVFRVSDTGGGIPKNELRRVIEPFFRGASSMAKQVPGSGVGLSLVKRIAETFGGSLTVESIDRRGTNVTVRVPYRLGEPDEA